MDSPGLDQMITKMANTLKSVKLGGGEDEEPKFKLKGVKDGEGDITGGSNNEEGDITGGSDDTTAIHNNMLSGSNKLQEHTGGKKVGRPRKTSKKSSKKSSKKGSKRSSSPKRGSKKYTKRGSKEPVTMVGGKKRGSKKGSKKSSKRHSKKM